jgi:hypothetical protein
MQPEVSYHFSRLAKGHLDYAIRLAKGHLDYAIRLTRYIRRKYFVTFPRPGCDQGASWGGNTYPIPRTDVCTDTRNPSFTQPPWLPRRRKKAAISRSTSRYLCIEIYQYDARIDCAAFSLCLQYYYHYTAGISFLHGRLLDPGETQWSTFTIMARMCSSLY